MTLHVYFARRFLASFAYVFAAFFGIFFFLDLVEQVRRFDTDTVGLAQMVRLSLLNTPQGLYTILPLLVVFATIALFLSLSRSSELVITRSVGRSALRSLVAPSLVALALGAMAIAAFNPIVAATSKEYERSVTAYRAGAASVLSISEEGLWLRQGGSEGQTVIRASRANLDGTELFGVSFIAFGPDGAPLRRIEAESARLTSEGWQLQTAKIWPVDPGVNAEAQAVSTARMTVPSDLTVEQILDSFGTPASIPIWELPTFIDRLEAAGFSALRHQMWLSMELALPVYLVAMVLLGAGFTMRHPRVSNTGVMVLFAVLLGFGLFFLRNFAQILGESGQVPVLLAAWTPPLAAAGLSLGLLLHMEDG